MRYKCELCGKEFRTYPSWVKRYPIAGTRFCSHACAKKALGIESSIKKCLWCGKEFTPKKKSSRFCSAPCYSAYRQAQLQAQSIERECPVCGKKIRNARTKYCSRECFHISMRGPRGPRPSKWIELVCPVCGKTFRIYKRDLVTKKGTIRTFCSPTCSAKGRWKMGIKPKLAD
ncbi:MAG: hypothetical protein ACP5QG_08485 [candidate division WOR-3 bacterium]